MRSQLLSRFAAFLCLVEISGTASTAELQSIELEQVNSAHQQNYDALERAPMRHWGDLHEMEPWNDLRHTLSTAARRNEAGLQNAAAVQKRFDAIYANYVEHLGLTPVGDILVGSDGNITVAPQTIRCQLFVDLPTALCFRVQTADWTQRISIAAALSNGVEIDGQTLMPAGGLTLYAVLPVTALGAPDRRELTLGVSSSGHHAEIPLIVDVKPSGRLVGTVCADGEGDRAPLAAKLFVEDREGRLYVERGAPNYATQNWYAPWLPRFTYVEGKFDLRLAPGMYRVTVMKGPGYAQWSGAATVEAGRTVEMPIRIRSVWPLEQRGWLCADMHTHARHIPLTMLRAEDINVVTRTFYSSNRPYTPRVDTENSDTLHLSAENQEIEHWNFGNAFYFNIPASVQDPREGPIEMTPLFHYDQQAHESGGITLRYMRSRPFDPRGGGQQQPELAVSAALGLMDVWTVLENSMQNLLGDPRNRWSGHGWPDDRIYRHTYRTWYALADCGLRIPIAAGTSYGRLSRLGFNRVYAKVNGELTPASWAAALVRGDGFVTNGPLLWISADGCLPGDGLSLETPGAVKVRIQLASDQPIRLVELLQDGDVVASHELSTRQPDQTMGWEEEVRVDKPCWLAARCFGEAEVRYAHQASPNQFAHTNILMVTVAGERPASASSAKQFVNEIDALIQFAPNIPGAMMRQQALELYHEARRYFARQCE